jgi:hypothetical protein
VRSAETLQRGVAHRAARHEQIIEAARTLVHAVMGAHHGQRHRSRLKPVHGGGRRFSRPPAIWCSRDARHRGDVDASFRRTFEQLLAPHARMAIQIRGVV